MKQNTLSFLYPLNIYVMFVLGSNIPYQVIGPYHAWV